MNSLQIFITIFALIYAASAQQWTPQQLAAYQQQQYYNWWYNQQQMQFQQFQQQPQAQPAVQPAPQSPFGAGAQSDSKGNQWHGDDNAKLMLFAKSSWP